LLLSSSDDATKVGGQANTEVGDKYLEGCRAVGTGNVEECQGSGSDSSSRFQSERGHHEARGILRYSSFLRSSAMIEATFPCTSEECSPSFLQEAVVGSATTTSKKAVCPAFVYARSEPRVDARTELFKIFVLKKCVAAHLQKATNLSDNLMVTLIHKWLDKFELLTKKHDTIKRYTIERAAST
jgi:hypothetical protein